MLVVTVYFVLTRKNADWGEGLLGILLVFWSQHILMQINVDLIFVSLHVDCRVQMLGLVLVNFGDGAVFSFLSVDFLDQL